MKAIVRTALCLAALQPIACLAAEIEPQGRLYEGAGCVSAAVAIAKDAFVTCSGQDNVLRVYQTTGPTTAVAGLDVSEFLALDGEPADIQGAARIGNRIYWIASHSRNEEGRIRPGRYRFFATTIKKTEAGFDIEPVGKPCTTLLNKLPNLNTVSTLQLGKAMRLGEELPERQRQRLAPEREGLRIEALCADPRTEILFIGFRNPRPVRVLTGRPHALVIPLNNAAEVVEKGKAPIFGEAMLWDFGGLGITSFEYSPAHAMHFILAQPHDGNDPATLYRWSGMKAGPPESIRTLCPTGVKADAKTIVAFDDPDTLLLLSGAGEPVGATPSERQFQGICLLQSGASQACPDR
jgi:hypothetical protein